MDSLTSGTFVGAGSFRCARCDYALTLTGSDMLPGCPGCGGREFLRASLFSTQRIPARAGAGHAEGNEAALVQPPAPTREWTRIGRSLAADLRFDDPTVSRRHALIVRHPDGVRLLDDRSLNGVFVNGARVDGKALQDGDEIIVGRYRLAFVSVPADFAAPGVHDEESSLHRVG